MTIITCIEDLRVLAQKRVPRMFRLVGSNGRETGDAYSTWFDAVAAALKSPESYAAISIYSRVAFFESR